MALSTYMLAKVQLARQPYVTRRWIATGIITGGFRGRSCIVHLFVWVFWFFAFSVKRRKATDFLDTVEHIQLNIFNVIPYLFIITIMLIDYRYCRNILYECLPDCSYVCLPVLLPFDHSLLY
jgi:hypothetical protein